MSEPESTKSQLARLYGEAQRLAGDHLPTLLDRLSESGLAWRDIAAIAGVSVPALRKWRKGGAATAENRLRIAFAVALIDWLGRDKVIFDVASWLEIPLDSNAPVSRLDLLVAGREDLIIESVTGSETTGAALLDRFDRGWRVRHRSDFEVFEATDGQRSIRRRT